MNQTSTGWILFIAAMGMMASLMSFDVATLKSWHDAFAPSFIALMLAHIGTVITAFVGGKLIPPDRDPNAHDRVTDQKLSEINKSESRTTS